MPMDIHVPITQKNTAFPSTHVEIAQKYMDERQCLNNENVLALVADSIVLQSGRDGTHSGIEAFKSYLSKVGPCGKWQNAQYDPKREKVVIHGKVKIFFIEISVISVFEFDKDHKITKIDIGRA